MILKSRRTKKKNSRARRKPKKRNEKIKKKTFVQKFESIFSSRSQSLAFKSQFKVMNRKIFYLRQKTVFKKKNNKKNNSTLIFFLVVKVRIENKKNKKVKIQNFLKREKKNESKQINFIGMKKYVQAENKFEKFFW